MNELDWLGTARGFKEMDVRRAKKELDRATAELHLATQAYEECKRKWDANKLEGREEVTR